MEQKIYYAKSERLDGSKPTVAQHVTMVAEKAYEYGSDLQLSEEARLAGLFHDFGKYSEAFQGVLRGTHKNIDHAACGAAVLNYACKGKPAVNMRSVIEAINGHHAGLRNFDSIEPFLKDSMKGKTYLTINDGKTPALNGQAEYKQAMAQFRAEHPEAKTVLPAKTVSGQAGNLETMLATRMVFSCLVDADYSVSAWEDHHEYFETTKSVPLDAQAGLQALYSYCEEIRKNSKSNEELNKLRNWVFDRCGACGEQEDSGVFTLTAPTGTGKTLALLHFALRHAIAHRKKRIIIVLPFLTLAEQNSHTYAKMIPSVLVDHSQSRLPAELREFTAKWNVPFIITTSVKFFETLFAQQPGDCRKLHNYAESIVVFDEAQSLPPHLIATTLKAINELCDRYRMTMVFSTATQPDFDAIPDVAWNPKEILPEYAELYQKLRRTQVDWQLEERIPLEDIARSMLEQPSVCGIFNLRRHARKVFELLQAEEPEAAFLISTDLCPAHRTEVIQTIRKRLEDGLPCRVAATQCIEAGVDLDFQVLYRALAPLDSIIQAAGRCNRNGMQTMANVTVFEPAETRLYPDKWYQNAADLVKELVCNSGLDIHDPDDIRDYYRRLFADAQDKKELRKAIRERDFEAVDTHYRLIPDSGEKLIVPYAGMAERYQELSEELSRNGITPGLMKEAAPLTITVFDNGELLQYAEPILTRGRSKEERHHSGYWMLRAQYRHLYTADGGLKLPEKEKVAEEFGFLY